ncbi:DUF1851 domain-containing protein [Gemmata obscuriglobus]|nr:DUF1851 domain-containing protein [Gemmata obscuriglobus]
MAVAEDSVPWRMNRYGDLFLISSDGAVSMLDVGTGTLTTVASNATSFDAQLTDEEIADQWLMGSLVESAVAAGLMIGRGECYGFKRPPVLGGDYTVENTFVLPVSEHLAFLGELHKQLRDMPDGSSVELKIRREGD